MLGKAIFAFIVSLAVSLTACALFNLNKQEFAASPPLLLGAETAPKNLKVLTWNIKHFGSRESLNLGGVVKVLAEQKPDIITIQELVKSSGATRLRELANELTKTWKEEVCFGFSEAPTGSKERYGYLWRISQIYYVSSTKEKSLALKRQCRAEGEDIPLASEYGNAIIREPAAGIFYDQRHGKLFVLASIHLVPPNKGPEKEVDPLFKFAFKTVEQYSSPNQNIAAGSEELEESFNPLHPNNPMPIIIAGDFNLGASHDVYENSARQLGFEPVLTNQATSLKRSKRELNNPFDNMWYRYITLEKSEIINLYRFPSFLKLSIEDIYNGISDHSPVVAVFAFKEKLAAEL
jgi:endonuclease/exonuclease/phosphatase family metal-dependent hydrolase